MAISVLLIGISGSGKSTSLFANKDLSIKGLNPKETFIINISKKDLPFKNWKKLYTTFTKTTTTTANILHSDDSKTILQTIKFVNEERKDIKNLIIEDTNLASSRTFFNRFGEHSYDLWNDIGGELGSIILYKDKLREDLNTIYIFHSQTIEREKGTTEHKVKSLGKLIENYLDIPSKFTYVFHAIKSFNPVTEKTERVFWTNNLEGSPCKSPYGCFDTDTINNDMGLILDKINYRKYLHKIYIPDVQ